MAKRLDARLLGLRAVLVLFTLGLIGAIIAYEVARKPTPVAAPAIEARLELVAGEVVVDQAGASQRANGPTALLSGAVVKSGAGARALIRLPDGSSAFMRADSEFALGDDGVSLRRGEYWLDAPAVERSSLLHRIGEVGVAAVDAGLSIRKDDDSAVSVYVARGMAVVTSSGGRVEVHAGELARVKGDDGPRVRAVAFWEDWTGGMADLGAGVATVAAGNGEIYAIDSGGPKGRPAERMQVKSQSVRAVIRDGVSETLVDQTFFNPSPRAVEGWYWFTVPEGASVTSFAVETNGELVEGELIERREASAKYTAAKRAGHAPAILEWVNHRTFRARIFPIQPSATRRVVLRYLELLPVAYGKLTYVYPMAGRSALRIGEFSLLVDLGEEGREMEIATLAEARVEANGERVTMRRSGFTPRTDFQLEATLKEREPSLRMSRFETGDEGADYVMMRYTPQVEWAGALQPRADVVVVVDTSAAADEATRHLQSTLTESILRSLSPEDRFTLLALDVVPRVLHPAEGLAEASDGQIATALEVLAGHAPGGASDLASFFEVALSRVHDATQPAIVYVGDGVATSGEQTGEQLLERLRRALATSTARLFTVAVGADADRALLGELARAGGGISFGVEDARFATATALQLTAAFKVPTLTDFELDFGAGLDEPLSNVSGKVTQGTEVVVLARTHHDLPKTMTARGRLGGKNFEEKLRVANDKSVASAFVPRLWASAYVQRLLGASMGTEVERGRIVDFGVDYGLMTPFTSIVALENEAAYSNMGIQRRSSPLRGVRLTELSNASERQLAATLHNTAAPVAFGCWGSSADIPSRSGEDSRDAPVQPEEDEAEIRGGNRYGVPKIVQDESTLKARQEGLHEATEFGGDRPAWHWSGPPPRHPP